MGKKLPRKAYQPRAQIGAGGVFDPNAIHVGDVAGGDLSGTYPNPQVLDDSHNHTQATLPPLGDSIFVNAAPVVDANLNDLVPAAGNAFGVNVLWQKTGAGPASVSAYIDDGKRAKGEWSFQGDITPPALVASVNNYNPTGLDTATVLRLSAT